MSCLLIFSNSGEAHQKKKREYNLCDWRDTACCYHVSPILQDPPPQILVDDQALVVPCLPPGSRFLEGEVRILKEEVEADLLIPGDMMTALVIKDIANTTFIHTTIIVEYPSNNTSM